MPDRSRAIIALCCLLLLPVIATAGDVTRLVLVNADTDRDIRPLTDGDTIDLSRDGQNLNVRAETTGQVAAVVFSVDGKQISSERTAPYALGGDRNGDYGAWTPSEGARTIKAAPKGKGKALSIRVKVVAGAAGTAGESKPSGRPVETPAETRKPTQPDVNVSIPTGAVVYQEASDVIVFEIESARPSGSGWKAETDLKGYTGKGYYTWRAGNSFRNPGQGALTYRILIQTGGTYNLSIHNRHDFHDSTLENDCWTRMDGGKWIKTFSSKRGAWTFASRHEHSHNKKIQAAYDLKPGLHVFQISGRSNGFSIDRVHLYRPGTRNATDTSLPETRIVVKPAPAKPVEPVKPVAPIGPTPPPAGGTAKMTGELKKWHRVTLTFDGPDTAEDATPNPFTDYALQVTFRRGAKRTEVTGYYAADGNAGETGATKGGKWRVHFVPDEEGEWTWSADFRAGRNIAILRRSMGKPTSFHGASGTFDIAPTDKTGRDLRGKGLLRYVGKGHLQFAETGEFYLKGGADSPENFLGYVDFDGTHDTAGHKRNQQSKFLHRYEPHVRDFRPGDPTWRGGKGKGIIGALNYLASKGMNSVYFLTYNIDGGDGKDTWPWTSPTERFRFDCSKLDQWEIVFSHMDRMGIQLHVITQETENDQGLDKGNLGPTRMLYYRELVARFAHHLAVTWNLGEENTNTDAQRKAFGTYLHAFDPYDHPVVLHTFPGKYEQVYRPLLGFAGMEGLSVQTNADVKVIPGITRQWAQRSARAGRPWVICIDEPGSAQAGALPDRDDPNHDEMRTWALWGNLMAGGAGVEWYFGYKYAHSDLNCEDWRSRDRLWDQTRYAIEFFQQHLPFTEMRSADDLTSATDDLCLAKPGAVYAIYLPRGGTTDVKLPPGTFTVHWYNPRRGGALQSGSVRQLTGGAKSIGKPPADTNKDWVVLVKRTAISE